MGEQVEGSWISEVVRVPASGCIDQLIDFYHLCRSAGFQTPRRYRSADLEWSVSVPLTNMLELRLR
jgi:hypothetical protein